MSIARIEAMEANLRRQQQCLVELIDTALIAVRESGDSSVTAMHLNTRLLELAKQLDDGFLPAAPTNVRALPQTARRPI